MESGDGEKIWREENLAIVCIVIFFGVIAFSAGIDILKIMPFPAPGKICPFVTECGDNAVMTSYVPD